MQSSFHSIELWRLIQESKWDEANAFLLRKNASPAKNRSLKSYVTWSASIPTGNAPNLLLSSLEKRAPSKFVLTLLQSDKNWTSENNEGGAALHLAIQNVYCLDVVKTIIRDCAPTSIMAPNADGKLPLYCAILFQRESEIVLFLLESFQDAAAVPLPQSCYLPIHAAIPRKYSLEVIQAIVEAYPGALKTALQFSNHLPLHLAIESKAHAKVIRYLIDRRPRSAAMKASDGSLPIHLLLADPNMVKLKLIQRLVEACPGSLKVGDANMKLPLHLALEQNNIDVSIIRYILEKDKLALKVASRDGNLPLHCAVFSKCPLEVIQLIADANLDCLNQPNAMGQLPLHIAVEKKCDVEVVSFLIEQNKQAVAVKAKERDLPLFVAMSHEYPFDVITSLVSAFPDVLKMTNSKGDYPVHVAIKRNDMNSAMLFLSMFQNVAAFKCGNTLTLHLAIECCASTGLICALLLSFPRSINITSNGNLPRDLTSFATEPLILIALEKSISYWALNARQLKSKSLSSVADDVMNDLEVHGVATTGKDTDEVMMKSIVAEAMADMIKHEEQHRRETMQSVENSMELMRKDIRKEVVSGFEPIVSCLDTLSKELNNIRADIKSDAANKISAKSVLQRVETEFGGELKKLKAAVVARLDALENSISKDYVSTTSSSESADY